MRGTYTIHALFSTCVADLKLRAEGTTVFSLPLPQGLKEDTAADIGPTT